MNENRKALVVVAPYGNKSSLGANQQIQSHQHQHQLSQSGICINPERSAHLSSNLTKPHTNGLINQIKGPSGSVRGHKDVVRQTLNNLKRAAVISQRISEQNQHQLITFSGDLSPLLKFCISQQDQKQNNLRHASSLKKIKQLEEIRRLHLEGFLHDEYDRCVAYTTSLGIVRRTFEDSKHMRNILNLNLIRFEERDVYLNHEFKAQLLIRCNSIRVPALFVDGRFVGGIKELEMMNETGQLATNLARFKMSKARKDICVCCGNARFIACPSCNGSRKSSIQHLKLKSIVLRCIRCTKNDGLVQCSECAP